MGINVDINKLCIEMKPYYCPFSIAGFVQQTIENNCNIMNCLDGYNLLSMTTNRSGFFL